MNKLRNALPHICFILSGTFIVLLIADKFNEEMAFINNGLAKAMLFAFCIVAILVSILQMLFNNRSRE